MDVEPTRPPGSLGLLLVDPEPDARTHVVDLCTRTGAAQVIAEVSLGAKAFQVAEAMRPDIILVASSLSDMTGLEALRRRGWQVE
jgi:CheY-like chemotaxis protein